MKKTVLEFVYYLFDGGAETLVKEYCLSIDYDKFNIVVLTLYPNYDSSVYNTLKNNKVRIYNIYPKRSCFYRLINKFFGKFYFPYKLRNIIKKEKISVIHAHTAVLRYLKNSEKYLTRVKLLYTCHSVPSRYFEGSMRDEYYAAQYLIKENNLQIIALHENMRNQLNSYFDINNVEVIKNGIDLKKYYKSDIRKKALRELFNIPQDAFVIGHIGRFFDPKNHDFLVKLFIKIKEKKSNAYLLMIGDGDLKESVSQRLKDASLSSDFLILSNRSDVPDLLKMMDVFVFPSKVEGFGIALIEAQASGLKCVASTNVPDVACLTNLVVKRSLDESVDKWCKSVLSDDPTTVLGMDNLNQYDIKSEIKKLESLYEVNR